MESLIIEMLGKINLDKANHFIFQLVQNDQMEQYKWMTNNIEFITFEIKPLNAKLCSLNLEENYIPSK